MASIALLLLVFSGSVGVPLFTHTCLEEKVTIHTLFSASDHCDDMKAATPEKQHISCCEAPKQLVKDRCCSEEAKHLAMKFDFFEHWQTQAAIITQPFTDIHKYLPYTVLFSEDQEVLFATNTDPPPRSGREILHQICIWRL